ncbi:hypothetical protein E4T56_gene15575 [Termitomyces sp. T112]|nr:hypothetical protein E4T56_gene15575 [Termitomyces sp. T112]
MASFFARPGADRTIRFRLGWYLAMACLWFVGLSVGITLLYRVVPPPITLTMLFDKNGFSKTWTPLSRIDRKMVDAVIAGEDARFCIHHGFDGAGIEYALERNLSGDGSKLRGGSTISQQTAKNTFLWQGSGVTRFIRKGLEAAGIAVLGVLPRRADLTLPERHLGLVQAVEHPDLERAMGDYADFLRRHVDLAALRAAARGWPVGRGAGRLPPPPAQRIAMARDEAFSFLYPHLLAGWREAGAQILPFSPLGDEAPSPEADLVWLPGGYPELHGGRIAAAQNFLLGLRRHARTRPVHGECGGYMVLGEGLIDKAGERHRMAGLLGLVTSHAKRKMHLGYRHADLLAPIGGIAVG